MMKKIFSKYFVVAVVAVAMGCISSCKDFEDEMYSELRGQDVALKKDLNEQIGKLRQEMKDSLQKARDEREALQDDLDAHIHDAAAKYATKDQLAAEKLDLEQQIAAGDATLQTKLNATNTRIDSLNNELDKVVNNIETLINDVAGVTSRIETLEQDYAKVEYVDEEIAKINSQLANYYTKEQTDSAIKAIAKNVQYIQNITEGITTNQEFISFVQQIKGGDADISDSLKKVITEVVNKANQNATEIATIKEQLCKIDCAALLEDLTDLQAKVDSIEEVCATLESDVEEAKALAEEAKEFAKEYTDLAIDKILAYTEPRFSSIEEMLAELFTQTEDQKDWLIEHEAEINELLADVEDLKNRVEANEKAIESLTERMDIVEDVLEKRISSVVLQATKSPVVGYFNIPMGIKSNVLAAYYGEAKYNVEFPSVSSVNMYHPQNRFPDEAADLLGFANLDVFKVEEGEGLFDDSEGNAGTLYVTINPAEVNLDGVEFSLVNSLDEVSYVKLGNFEESTEKLTFGYTRGANGFYEAKATVSADNAANAMMRVTPDDLQEVASNLKGSGLNLASIAANVQNLINDIADASAVKASWKDKKGAHNVYSEYALAAMTVEPLSFAFLEQYRREIFPGVGRIYNVVNRLVDSVKIEIPEVKVEDITIEGIDIKDDETVEVYVPELGHNITLNMKDVLGDFYKDFNISLEDLEKQVNEMLAQLNTINDVEQSIADAKENIKTELNKYLERLNNKLCGIYDCLQPSLLLKTEGGFAMLSQAKNKPTVLNAANCVLVPTTYTAEVLAPAYKKYVAVTNVFHGSESAQEGCADCISVLKAANNGDLNKVLDGTTNTVEFDAQSNGYIYEITYSALDYYGMCENVKYYVTVK